MFRESWLEKTPHRFNGLYGAFMAANKTGDQIAAKSYAVQLSAITKSASTKRPELALVKKMAG